MTIINTEFPLSVGSHHLLAKFQKKTEIINSSLRYDGWAEQQYTSAQAKWWIARTITTSGVESTTWAASGVNGEPTAIWDSRTSYFTPPPSSGYSTLSLIYDGVNDLTQTSGAFHNFARTDTFSISFWIRPITLTTTQIFLTDKNGATTRGWSIEMRNPGEITFLLCSSNNTNEIRSNTGAVLATNTWAHVVATYDGSVTPAGMKMYINGSSTTLTNTVNSLTNTIIDNRPFTIGSRANGGNYMNAHMDEVSIWNAVLTPTQVTNIYNSGKPTNLTGSANLISWYRMGENATFPSTIPDVVSGYDLTAFNMTTSAISTAVP